MIQARAQDSLPFPHLPFAAKVADDLGDVNSQAATGSPQDLRTVTKRHTVPLLPDDAELMGQREESF